MFRLIIIVVALLFALSGGAAGLIHFGVIPDFTGIIVDEAPTADDEAPPAAVRVPPVFVSVEPLTIPVIVDGQLKKNVYVAFRLEIAPEARSDVEVRLTQMRDVYITTLHKELGKQYKDRDIVDVATLKKQLLAVSQRALGKERVRDVVIEAVFNR